VVLLFLEGGKVPVNMIVSVKQVLNPEAKIFKAARFGVVSDWKKYPGFRGQSERTKGK